MSQKHINPAGPSPQGWLRIFSERKNMKAIEVIIIVALITMFSWSWASKDEPENMTLGDCYQEGQNWFCR